MVRSLYPDLADVGAGGAAATALAPFGDLALLRALDRQRVRRNIVGDHRAGGGVGTVPDRDWCDQGAVGAYEGVVADQGAPLLDPVVVGGDGAGANVDALPQHGIAEV